jgi:hypothetical protein
MLCALGLAMVFSVSAQAYTLSDRDSVPEPWSGWWWPMYHPDTLDSCPLCPHLWQGGLYGEGVSGTQYELGYEACQGTASAGRQVRLAQRERGAEGQALPPFRTPENMLG